jgi:hypothetical protein
MKHNIYFYINGVACLLISLLFLLNSCEKEDNDYADPEILIIYENGFISSDTSLYTGDTVYVKLKAVSLSEKPLTNIHIERITDDDTISIDTGIFNQSIIVQKLIVKSVAETERWIFTASDRNRKRSEAVSIILTKKESSTYGPINISHQLLLDFKTITTSMVSIHC